ncbi:hypothetical protein [Actinoplanes sp. RD1]|uniref:hypothetical protein n=1 Tax=Actinoplanes sp. RD1 TaxID=3064538 RepID=UPI0027412A32|nr:hypothetical protein [Actinoplanes sp. RD1]
MSLVPLQPTGAAPGLRVSVHLDWLPVGERGRLLLHRRLTGPGCPATDRCWLSGELLWHRLAALDPGGVHPAEAGLWRDLLTGRYVPGLDRPVPLEAVPADVVHGVLHTLPPGRQPRSLVTVAAQVEDTVAGPVLGRVTATSSRHDFLATALAPLVRARITALDLRQRPVTGDGAPARGDDPVARLGTIDDAIETRDLGGDHSVQVNRFVAYAPEAAADLLEAVRCSGVREELQDHPARREPADRFVDDLAGRGWRFWPEPVRLTVPRPVAELLHGSLFLQVRQPGRTVTYPLSPRPGLTELLGEVGGLLCPATGVPPADADLRRALGAVLQAFCAPL